MAEQQQQQKVRVAYVPVSKLDSFYDDIKDETGFDPDTVSGEFDIEAFKLRVFKGDASWPTYEEFAARYLVEEAKHASA